MNCASCGRANRDGARFCGGCGGSLAPRCPACGAECEADARFCDACGGSLAAKPVAPAGARKVVTIVFADLVGSTALHERLDPESARRFMESYYDAMRGAVESHGGTVTQLLGDGVKAVFGIPRVAEDDAIRAVRAAVAMQEAFRALADEQRGAVGKTGLRVAVNTGEVVANDESEIIGDPVNVAARLQEQGRDGDVVVGDSTARLVSSLVTLTSLGSFTLKGRAEAVAAFRVESLERPESAAIAAFVGRGAEIARITAVYETAVEKPATCLAVLLGSPGLGKSRMIDEFAHRLGDTATVVAAQCDAAGGATFAPLAEALREQLGIDAGASGDAIRAAIEVALPGEDGDRARIAGGVAALLSASPASPEETFFVVRRLFAALAATRPVVLVIDDLHWAEPLLLDLIEHLVQWGSGVPLLVLVGARPELRDMRSSLVTPGGLVADVVALAGLDAGAAMRLAANVIGAADLPAAVAAKVLATSEGNPLFVGELVRMLVHEGALKKDGDRWTAGTALAALEMPPTIHALLAARIERLRPEERAVLERAAVVGRHFSRSAVAELLPRDVTDLDARLESLRRSELIERDTGWFLGEPVLRFHHVLIRDAAYRRILKGTRAELHARFADWVLAKAGDAIEHDETIGWHLEQAHQHLRGLGPIDAKGRALGERASKHLAAAGRRALARDDLPLAASLLGRALERLDPDDPARADLALDWCEALLASGDVGPAAGAIDELGRFIADSERLRAWHTCFASQHLVLTAPSALHATADTVATAADELTALGDASGEAKAHYVHALALSRLGKVGACEAALDRALAAARRAGDRRRANTVLAIAPLAALWGPSPVTRASGRCLDVVRVLRITQGAPAVEAVALSCQGVLEALRGRGDAARRMIASARKMVEELGITQRLLEADVFGGLVELLEGDAPAAERSLRGAYDGLRDLGLGIDAARAAALLARALLAQDRVEEAELLSHESEALAGDDLKAAIAWRGVRAEALAKRGEHAVAVEFASKAVELAAATDALLDHADARLALAAALRAAGRGREADAEERRATELWEAKGATLLAERARTDGGREAKVAAASPEPVVTPPVVPRRVPPNATTAMMASFDGAVAARDFDALAAVFHADHQEIDHPTGSTYGRDACIASMQRLFRSNQPYYQAEPIASLGEFLLLVRRRSGAGGASSGRYDVGAYENEAFQLFEVDEDGLCFRSEVFGTDHLGDAIARLYERHAELLPDGPERDRAAMTARVVTVMLTASVEQSFAESVAPGFEAIDHRLVGHGLVGAEALERGFAALRDLTDAVQIRTDAVLAASADALLRRSTSSGILRASGGAFERTTTMLSVFGPDGRVTRSEVFDLAQEAEALARFDALTAEPAEPRSVQRRVRPNAASAVMARFEAAFAARDFETLEALYAEAATVIDHPNGASYGRAGEIASIRGLLRARETRWRHTPLATLGDALSLHRRSISALGTDGGRFDVADYEVDHIVVIEVDERGRYWRVEVFGADQLGDAIARLYERYAELLPEGPSRARAAATARSVAVVAPGGVDVDRYTAVFRPDAEIVDHKLLGFGTDSGPERLFRRMAATAEVGDQVVSRPQGVLALTQDALLLRWLVSGVGRESGGAFEWAFLRLFVFNAEGCVARYELFDIGREAEALARFDALVGSEESAREPSTAQFENAASRAVDRETKCFAARDWDGLVALLSPAIRFSDRRQLMRAECGYDGYLAQERLLFDQSLSRWQQPLRATRGERLSLHRVSFEAEAEAGGGPLALEDHFAVVEVDANGRWIAVVLFDFADEDAAYAELDARFDAGEGTVHERASAWMRAFERGIASRDWDALVARSAPALVAQDHRPIGWGTLRGPAAWVETLRAMIDLAPDARLRIDHLRTSGRGVLFEGTWLGTRDGGPFEIPVLPVAELDELGNQRRLDLYDPTQHAQAQARFDELNAAAPQPVRFANAATRTVERAAAMFKARDWLGFAALFAAECRIDDRTALAQIETARDEWLAAFRQMIELTSARPEPQVLATRGDRLVLFRMRWQGAAGDVGPSEVDWLLLALVDAHGDHVLVVSFEPTAQGAAYAELDACFETHEGGPHGNGWRAFLAVHGAVARRDWNALAAALNPRFLCDDHRRLSFGTTLDSVDVWVRSQQSLAELAPDFQYRFDHVRTSSRGFVAQVAQVGTREGGAFESPFVYVAALDASGRPDRFDPYDVEDVDRALARFDELNAAAPLPVRFANAASRASDRLVACWLAGDWQGLAQRLPAAFRFLDRRRIALLEAGREQYLESVRVLGEMSSTHIESELLATRGERLALSRRRVEISGGDVGPSEIANLTVIETDERGDPIALVRFDLDDEDAAYAELDARWAAGEAAAHPLASAWVAAFRRGFAARDWAAMAALTTHDQVAVNHRLLGWGTMSGPGAWVPALEALVGLAEDTKLRIDHLRTCERGLLWTSLWHGTRDGGAFETPIISFVELAALGRESHMDVWDIEQLEVAFERFESLRATTQRDPLAVPSAATAATERLPAAFAAGAATGDWEPMRELCAPDMRYEDRQRLSQISGDRELFLASLRERVAAGAVPTASLVGTAGDRVNVSRYLYSGGPPDGRFEIEFLSVFEVGASGLITAIVMFDPDDAREARREAWARWAAIDPVAAPWVALLNELADAWNAQDLARVRACFADDVVVEDHRVAGLGRIEGADAYVESFVALWDLAPDQRVEFRRSCAVDRHGVVFSLLRAGTLENGGAFESEYAWLALATGGRITRLELFEIDALDAALARFEELGAGRE